MPEWIIPHEDAGKKLISFLTERLGDQHSARSLKRSLEHNCCQINGRVERFASAILAKGDYVKFELLQTESGPSSTFQFDPGRILFEDDSFLIYNKPAGINSDEKGILKLLRPIYPTLQLIHRLDRDTTGILLLAKNSALFEQMIQEFKQHRVRKVYVAIVDGILEKQKGVIDNFLGKKHVYAGQAIWGKVHPEKGLHAHTEWIKIKEGKEATLVYCLPLTGRTHQIRVHMAEMKHPILGDFQYAKRFRCPYRPKRFLLHAYQITFEHPVTRKKVDILAPLPDDFNHALTEIFRFKFPL